MTGTEAPSGLRQAFLTVRPLLLRLVRARGVALDEAEDILQELYLKLDHINAQPIADPTAYLCRMASNLVLDHRRSAERRAQRQDDWSEAHSGTERDMDDSPSVEQQMLARERLQRVETALAALPPRTVNIFLQFRLEGLGQRAIAEAEGISLSAVEKHLQRAYRAIVDVRVQLDADSDAGRRLPNERDKNVDEDR